MSDNPQAASFVDVPSDSPFSIHNLPYGVFRPRAGGRPRVGVAIGGQILDLAVLEARGLLGLPPSGQPVFDQPSLNTFLELGQTAWQRVRGTIGRMLAADEPSLRDNRELREQALVRQDNVEMLLPLEIGDYTDFYSSKDHAANCGRIVLGPDNPLPRNWLHMPIAYHGRASSVVVSGTDIRRPCGQYLPSGADQPVFGPSQAMDFELEMGFVVGTGNPLGEPISTNRVWEHLFGMVLLNDWSARDLQGWELHPLGPFLSKNLATSISPWVVPMDAIWPFRVAGPTQDPSPLPYLQMDENTTFDIHLEVGLRTPGSDRPAAICKSNLRHVYWNVCQQVAHHTISGCNLRPGDLLGTGTLSGPTPDSLGCLLEATHGGTKPLELPGGETRRFLEDGDAVTMQAWCQGDGYRVGFGDVSGTLLPAHS